MANNFSIKINGLDSLIANSKRAGPQFTQGLKVAMRDSVLLTQNNASKIVPGRFKNQTGNLRRSISQKVFGADKGLVFVNDTAPYGEYVEFGTKPHVIRPKNRKMLAFKSNGITIFAKKINHPGSKPYPFMEPAFQESQPQIERIYDAIGDTLVRELSK